MGMEKANNMKLTKLEKLNQAVAVAQAKKAAYVPCMVPMRKLVSASVRRPGNFTGNRKPSTTASQASTHAEVSRQRLRAGGIRAEFNKITAKFGGEPRKIRRQLARDIAAKNLGRMAK